MINYIQSEVGLKDYVGREILHSFQVLNGPPGSKNVTILLNKFGNLELANIYNIQKIIVHQKEAITFSMPYIPVSFSLKGAGKTYEINGDDRHGAKYSFNWDGYGNMLIAPRYKDREFKMDIFLTKLQVFIIRRARDKKRKEINDAKSRRYSNS
jgi:hypothetical protein